MAYGHAERNLALLRQLEAETRQLLESLDQPDPQQSAWLQEVTSRERADEAHSRAKEVHARGTRGSAPSWLSRSDRRRWPRLSDLLRYVPLIAA
jgi:hypothetical protein